MEGMGPRQSTCQCLTRRGCLGFRLMTSLVTILTLSGMHTPSYSLMLYPNTRTCSPPMNLFVRLPRNMEPSMHSSLLRPLPRGPVILSYNGCSTQGSSLRLLRTTWTHTWTPGIGASPCRGCSLHELYIDNSERNMSTLVQTLHFASERLV
jgi:hypothetical protein